MRKIVIIISLLFTALSGYAQLSSDSRIYLVTVSPGDELYSAFGHSAVWVADPQKNIDLVFNYGTFDFNTPNFYTKFMMGKLDYMLSVGRINHLLRGAKAENRSVYLQELDLDSALKSQIYAFLVNNARPENKFYRYDFLFDNCSTRIRDILEDILGEDLEWRKEPKNLSFRKFLKIYVKDKEWIDLGFDLILGQSLENHASAREEMFLPEELMDGFDRAYFQGRPLLRDTRTLYEAEIVPAKTKVFTPGTLFWFIAIIGFFLSIRQHKYGFHIKIFDRVLFFITGLIGLLIVILWFFTEHHVTVDNWNILWANPVNLVLPFLLFHRESSTWQQIYYVVFGIICFFVVGFYYALPQQLHPATFPIVLYMCFRSFNVFYKTKRMY